MPKRLETERLILKPVDEDDKDFILGMDSDPAIMKYMPVQNLSLDEIKQQENWLEYSEGKIKIGAWVVQQKETSASIGTVVFCQMPLTDPVYDPVEYTDHIEIGYRFIPSSWGKGYATEVARRALQYAFEETDIEIIAGGADPENTGSLKALEKIGMTRQDDIVCYGELSPFFTITREEWLAS